MKPEVRCAYVCDGQQCPRDPEDGRVIPVNELDGVVVLLCLAHCQVYDAISWANRRRD